MLYEHERDGRVALTFQGELEVETVSLAFWEYICKLETIGNDSSISKFMREVSCWSGTEQVYRGSDHATVLEALEHFSYNTDDALEEMDKNERTKTELDRRVEYGEYAAELIGTIELQSDMEDMFADLLDAA